MEHKSKIQALGDELLDKETVGLTEIINILGERPFGMNEAMTNYLEEMKRRQEKDKEENTDDKSE